VVFQYSLKLIDLKFDRFDFPHTVLVPVVEAYVVATELNNLVACFEDVAKDLSTTGCNMLLARIRGESGNLERETD
jgi:hypothetical protein